MKQNQYWLEVAEYSTFAGGIASLIHRPIAAAAVPFFAAYLWLSLKQRQAHDRAIRQRIAESSLTPHEQPHTSTARQIEELQTAFIRLEQSTTASIDRVQERCDRAVSQHSQQIHQVVADHTQTLLNLQRLKEQFMDLDQSCSDLHDRTRKIEAEQISSLVENYNSLDRRMLTVEGKRQGTLPTVRDTAATRSWVGQLLGERIAELINEIAVRDRELREQVFGDIQQQFININQQLIRMQPKYEYRLLCGRVESRRVLMDALNQCSEQLIMVCPWIHAPAINGENSKVLEALKKLLHKQRKIDLGWGNCNDFNESDIQVSEQVGKAKFNAAFKDIKELKVNYPNYFRWKILGTHEKYLVCDRKFAMLGSHNFLTSGDSAWRQDREVGIYTTDPHIIEQLIDRYYQADNLEAA